MIKTFTHLFYLFLLLPAAAMAQPVMFEAKNSTTGQSTSLSWSHTVGTNGDRLLVVGVTNQSPSPANSVTYGGLPLTKLATQTFSGVDAELWYLVDPPSGTATVSLTKGSTSRIIAGSVSFYNVDQANPFSYVDSIQVTANNVSLTIYSAPDEIVIDVGGESSAALTPNPTSGQTLLWSTVTNHAGCASYKTGSDTVIMSWNFASSVTRTWTLVGASIKAASCVSGSLKPTNITSSTGASACPGKASTLTQVGGTLGANAQWKWYTGGCGTTLIDSGESITVMPTATTTYYVRAEDSLCITSCRSITLTVTGTPITPVIFGPLSLCGGQSTSLSIVNNPCGSGGCTYFWSNGDTGLTITVSPSRTTVYRAYVANGCGDTAVSANYTVNVTPAVPTISVSGNVLTCSNTTASFYQWLEGGVPISAPSSFQYTVTQDGCYSVRITDGNGCMITSDSVCVIFTGVSSDVQSSKFKVYPNPAGDRFMIYLSAGQADDLRYSNGTKTLVEMYDVWGSKVLQSEITTDKSEIDVSGIAKGVYFIRIVSGAMTGYLKLAVNGQD